MQPFNKKEDQMESKESDLFAQRRKIFQEWQKSYYKALIEELQPTGDVLEVGFGTGLAADYIQEKHPKSHTIIEFHPQIVPQAEAWVKEHPQVKLIKSESWEQALSKEEKFDQIFYEECAPSLEKELEAFHYLFPSDTVQQASQAKELLDLLSQEMKQLTRTFSDSDVEDFYQKIGRFHKAELPKFFLTLRDNDNITAQQYENFIKNYLVNEPLASSPQNRISADGMLHCLELCLAKHMRKGSRFSCYLTSQISKYQDALFFDRIITNTDLDYKEKIVSLKLPDKNREALVISVEKA